VRELREVVGGDDPLLAIAEASHGRRLGGGMTILSYRARALRRESEANGE
jgi:hypothetical protein